MIEHNAKSFVILKAISSELTSELGRRCRPTTHKVDN